jgi:hypothetical protein
MQKPQARRSHISERQTNNLQAKKARADAIAISISVALTSPHQARRPIFNLLENKIAPL